VKREKAIPYNRLNMSLKSSEVLSKEASKEEKEHF
jgi:hypothetical protein